MPRAVAHQKEGLWGFYAHPEGSVVREPPRRRVGSNTRRDKQVVGTLNGNLGGEECSILVTLKNVFWVGRHPSCDLVLDSPQVSNFHLRIFAVRTATELSVVCVHDVSTNGFMYNGEVYSPQNNIQIHSRTFSHRSVVLRLGNTIQIPGCDTVWTYSHNIKDHLASTLRPLEHPVHTSVLPLFNSSSPDQQVTRGPWIIYNYPLGTGAYGVVHLAEHKDGGLQVACKTVARAKSRGVRDALRKEVKVMASLKHPNVLAILDMVEDDIQPDADAETPALQPGQEEPTPKYRPRMHLFLELVTGGDLFSYVEKYTMLTEDEVKFIAYQLIEGLRYLHSQDVVHRDIKPENILLYSSEAYPRIVIADFGMAITYNELLAGVPEHRHQSVERKFPNCGTTSYLPPERLRAIGRRAGNLKGIGESLKGTGEARRHQMARMWFDEEAQLDIYGAGLTLFICASGVHPYAKEDEDVDRQATQRPLPASEDQKVPEGYHPIQRWESQKGKQAWDTFRALTALWEESEPDGKTKKECRKYLELALAFAVRLCKDMADEKKIPAERWPQENWKTYTATAKDFLRRLISPTASNRPSLSQMFLHGWWRDDIVFVQQTYREIVHDGRTRIPLFADNKVSSQHSQAQPRPIEPITYKGKGKGKERMVKPADQEPLFLSVSSQISQLSQGYQDPIETYVTEPTARNGFAGRGRNLSIAGVDEDESIHQYSQSPSSVSTPSTTAALANEQNTKRAPTPSLSDLMRYGSRSSAPRGGHVMGQAGPGPKTNLYRRNSSIQLYKSQRSQSLMDKIHEDDEDEDENEAMDVDEVDEGTRREREMSVD